MSQRTLAEQLWSGLGSAINDIRQKVIEEPMYGRAVTEESQRELQWPDGKDAQPSFGSRTHEIERERDVGPEL